MKISIITVCYNSASTIRNTFDSVAKQNYKDIEYIVIDGQSTDSTIDIVEYYSGLITKFISERDNGIYDAMNKGFSHASGDIVGYLNSDDKYTNENILSNVVAAFNRSGCDYVYGDVEMRDSSGRLIRQWVTGEIERGNVDCHQIPHPSFFIKKQLLQALPKAFDDSFRLAADLKQQLIITTRLNALGYYIPKPLVVMMVGGASTKNLCSYIEGWIESRKAYNDIFGGGGTFFALRKIASKFKSIRSTNLFFKKK